MLPACLFVLFYGETVKAMLFFVSLSKCRRTLWTDVHDDGLYLPIVEFRLFRHYVIVCRFAFITCWLPQNQTVSLQFLVDHGDGGVCLNHTVANHRFHSV